jgi:hypothetical protein
MVVTVAVRLESFYKPELNAAANHRCETISQLPGDGAIIPYPLG